MATYEANGYYLVFNNGDNTYSLYTEFGAPAYYRMPNGAQIIDDAGDNTFAPGEDVTIYSNGTVEATGYYIGYTSEGVLIDVGSGPDAYVYYTDNDALTDVEPAFGPLVLCFLAGTRIATPEGERAIETLAIGDCVLTAEGEQRAVRWIGRQSVVSAFAEPLRGYPIRISAGALGENLPTRDLFVSPDHAVLVEGLLVQAGALVNGGSIARVERPDSRFTYYHVELEDHSLILAEGVPAETFVDNVTRRRFDNYAEYEALYGAGTAIAELELPRIKSARQLPLGLRRHLAARAEALALRTAA